MAISMSPLITASPLGLKTIVITAPDTDNQISRSERIFCRGAFADRAGEDSTSPAQK
jgi:hypothetical protein